MILILISSKLKHRFTQHWRNRIQERENLLASE